VNGRSQKIPVSPIQKCAGEKNKLGAERPLGGAGITQTSTAASTATRGRRGKEAEERN
jgi:hypothetical protein